MHQAALLRAVIAAASLAPGTAEVATIANALNVTRCLGVHQEKLTLVDCLGHVGAEWSWTSGTKGPRTGALQLAKSTAKLFMAREGEWCLDAELMFRSCGNSPTKWLWNRTTLQLQMYADGHTWCLGLLGHELLLDSCKVLYGNPRDEQNGHGAPACQTWIVLPARRPQVEMLHELEFPLRASGRHIIDSKGQRVKLAGLNWFGADLDQLVNHGLAVAPASRIVKTVKYMGFNSIRLSYAEAMITHSGIGAAAPVPNNHLLASRHWRCSMQWSRQ